MRVREARIGLELGGRDGAKTRWVSFQAGKGLDEACVKVIGVHSELASQRDEIGSGIVKPRAAVRQKRKSGGPRPKQSSSVYSPQIGTYSSPCS